MEKTKVHKDSQRTGGEKEEGTQRNPSFYQMCNTSKSCSKVAFCYRLNFCSRIWKSKDNLN